uniref:Homeobox domain-containing protein n=1 Tax=Sinocyclocheilus grahami TaxID=75366 RepID=A0A672R1D0_SINGR
MSYLCSSYLKVLNQICILTFPLSLPVTLEEQEEQAQTNQQQLNTNLRSTCHRSRTAFTTDQCERLEKEFIRGLYPDLLTREKLSEETNLPQNTIKASRVGVTRPGFLGSRNALISLSATSGSSLDGYMAHHSQSAFPLTHHRDKSTFPLAHLNLNAASTCQLDHTESLMPPCKHGNEESVYRFVPFITDERILMADHSQWASHQTLIGQNVSMF